MTRSDDPPDDDRDDPNRDDPNRDDPNRDDRDGRDPPDTPLPEAEATPEEREEAACLAHALERGHAPRGAPVDALATAAFLRFAKDGGVLAPERAERILQDVLAAARPRPRRVAPRVVYTFLGLIGLAAAGAASFVLLARTEPPGSPLALLPSPPRELLEAQLAAANSVAANPADNAAAANPADNTTAPGAAAKDANANANATAGFAALDDATSRYRHAVYATLRERHGQ